jgi:RHS repeat-associated protein
MAKANVIRFSTQFADDVTGDLKYLYRDYSPSTGRWKSRDPIEEYGGENLVAFVSNDPTDSIDVFGLADGPQLKPSDNSCCTKPLEDKGEYLLKGKYERAVANLRRREVPHFSTRGENSCITLNHIVFDALTPIPKCWSCRLEERQNSALVRLSNDHWQIICKGAVTGREISFDYWANRPPGEDPKNWFYKKYGPVLQTEGYDNNALVNGSHSTCSSPGIRRKDRTVNYPLPNFAPFGD